MYNKKTMDIIKKVKKLGFPIESYVVVGGGHMTALGLKEGKNRFMFQF